MDSGVAIQDRFDRHVQRGVLRLRSGTRFQATHALEEALRLIELPGEAEGRQYYFRHVALRTIPAQATRQQWIDRLQCALSDLAATAVHGADPRAAGQSAVYFDHWEQSLEMTLRRLLRPGSAIPWFLDQILGTLARGGAASPIVWVVEALQRPGIPAAVGAAILWSALGSEDASILLDALPENLVRRWIDDGGAHRGNGVARAPLDALRLPRMNTTMRTTLDSAARRVGWHDPRTVWLAAQAEQAAAATAITAREALRLARTRLRQWAQESAAAQNLDIGDHRASPSPESVITHSRDCVSRAGRGAVGAGLDSIVFDALGQLMASDELIGPIESRDPVARNSQVAASPVTATNRPVATVSGEIVTASQPAPPLLGDPTAAAGFFFLLPVLRRLGIAQVVAAHPILVEFGLAAQVFQCLAGRVGVADSDPILRCLGGASDCGLGDDGLAADASVAPDGWTTTPQMRTEGATLVRVWALAVRRWCWRNVGLTASQVVMRGGRVWLTRAELDVTLPHQAVDIRIRRSGLDLDPGWVPWLGPFGRVVRFHYRDPAQHD